MLHTLDLENATALAPESTSRDEDLMSRIQARDESALAEMLRIHKPLLRTVIARVVHTDADVDDTLQDVFLEVWNRSHLFDATKGKALGWLITMARRRAIDRVRRRQAYDRAEERMRLDAVQSPADTCECNVEADANLSDCSAMLREALATLPPPQREAVELAYFQGLSQREIAAKTHTPLGTIKTRLELGMRKVRTAVLAVAGEQEWSFATV